MNTTTVKSHSRRSRGGNARVKRHIRGFVEKFSEAKDISTKARKKLAVKGKALPDGSFPISSKRDLANAIRSVGRAKNYSKAKAHIIKRARQMGLGGALPPKWG